MSIGVIPLVVFQAFVRIDFTLFLLSNPVDNGLPY